VNEPIRRRGATGFTLVELMVVVAIAGLASAGLRIASRGVRGEKAPEVARNLLALVREAQHAAMTLQQPTRVRLASAGVAPSRRRATVTTTQWDALAGRTSLPGGIELCAVDAAAMLEAATPRCPLSSSTSICFDVSGRVSISADGSCPRVLPTGATIYLHTVDDVRKYKVAIFALTGTSRLVDTW